MIEIIIEFLTLFIKMLRKKKVRLDAKNNIYIYFFKLIICFYRIQVWAHSFPPDFLTLRLILLILVTFIQPFLVILFIHIPNPCTIPPIHSYLLILPFLPLGAKSLELKLQILPSFISFSLFPFFWFFTVFFPCKISSLLLVHKCCRYQPNISSMLDTLLIHFVTRVRRSSKYGL